MKFGGGKGGGRGGGRGGWCGAPTGWLRGREPGGTTTWLYDEDVIADVHAATTAPDVDDDGGRGGAG